MMVSVDIGSTYTKGAVFRLDGGHMALVRRSETPTTQDDLWRGFSEVLGGLIEAGSDKDLREISRNMPVRFSSSAKGGLRVVAVGLVPELTVEAARVAAFSAGGKVVGVFTHRLSRQDMKRLEALNPDVVLLTGGTDGGNERIVAMNAESLGASAYRGPVVFAGNLKALDAVAGAIPPGRLVVAANVMPDIGRLEVDEAREAIRRVFVKEIVKGKGLDKIAKVVDSEPQPTPLGVFKLTQVIAERQSEWRSMAIVDLGGATTDFYSAVPASREEPGDVVRGFDERGVKRTVEGDLGLRVSAATALEAMGARKEREAVSLGIKAADVEAYVCRSAEEPSFLSAHDNHALVELLLAKLCIGGAAERHAGRRRGVWTSSGKVMTRRGRDLRHVTRLIGTGGYLARSSDRQVYALACDGPHLAEDEGILLPESPDLYRDADHLFPLLGNVVAESPEAVVEMAVSVIKQL